LSGFFKKEANQLRREFAFLEWIVLANKKMEVKIFEPKNTNNN